ncbi:MAG TPA: VWA domain-containing protein [Chloroflexia bacterium]|nr:VWA domain-containing protein [Chloroflexia bacterium]
MVTFRVTPHPAEATALDGQTQARTLYSVGAEGVAGEAVPVFLGVAMDQSGSMSGQKLEAAKQALTNLLHQIPPTDDIVVHITLFSSAAHELAPPVTGRQLGAQLAELTRRIGRIEAGGATSLGSGLRVALGASARYANHVRRVLMITDGKQEGAEPIGDAYDMAKALAQAGLRVDAWGVGNGWEADQLRTIAHSTGGEADVIPDARHLGEAVAQLFADVQSTKASDVRLVLNTPKGTTIRSVRQVYPSVQERAARQVSEQQWVIPIGALGQEEPKFVVEIATPARNVGIPFRMLVPNVIYAQGGTDHTDELDRTAWFFVRWVATPAEVRMDPELSRFTGEEEITSLSQEGFALLDMGAVEEATAKLNAALRKAEQINSPQAAILGAVVNPQTGRLTSTDSNAAVNKTGKLHTGKTGKLLSGTGKLPPSGP